MRRSLFGVLVVVLAGCGGSDPARVKGRVVDGGQPVVVPQGEAPGAIILSPVGPDGTPDRAKLYTASLAADGAFELIASGGSVPPGNYQLSIEVPVKGKAGEKFKPFSGAQSPIRRELKPGQNDLTLDLANPNG